MEPLTIGQIKSLLKKLPVDAYVEYDFGELVPSGVGSYRGRYNEPCLYFDQKKNHGLIKVGQLLESLDELTTIEFTGWKGGEYRYNDSMVLHVAECGRTSNTYVVDIEMIGKESWNQVVIIRTAYIA